MFNLTSYKLPFIYRMLKISLSLGNEKPDLIQYDNSISQQKQLIAGTLESADSSILAVRRHFKEVVEEKIRIL